ncbi:hypothetical protein ACFV4P_30135 [Kitasatospora sp. NPDC059795]|uniref:hypothetical protein n=1 Tax=Kitasatospora sp. NPDC059795 TaxID=3346949 RepID=UPI003658A862
MTAGENGMQGAGGELPVELGLAAAAAEVTIGPVPVEGIVAGGRRIRRRRRSVVGALTLASVVALGGGTAVGLNGLGGNGGAAQAPALQAGDGPTDNPCEFVRMSWGPTEMDFGPTSGASYNSTTGPICVPVGTPSDGGATPAPDAGSSASSQASSSPSVPSSPASSGPRDPLRPQRAELSGGAVDGKKWTLRESLWPAAPQEKAYEQAVAIWEERHTVDPSLERPTEASVQHSWKPDEDIVNIYAELDGRRLKADTLSGFPAPGHVSPQQAKNVSGSVFGAPGTSGGLPTELAVVVVGPDVDKVVVDWSDGGSGAAGVKDAQLGGSPYRVAVVEARPGLHVAKWRFLDKQGVELPDPGLQLLNG